MFFSTFLCFLVSQSLALALGNLEVRMMSVLFYILPKYSVRQVRLEAMGSRNSLCISHLFSALADFDLQSLFMISSAADPPAAHVKKLSPSSSLFLLPQ